MAGQSSSKLTHCGGSLDHSRLANSKQRQSYEHGASPMMGPEGLFSTCATAFEGVLVDGYVLDGSVREGKCASWSCDGVGNT